MEVTLFSQLKQGHLEKKNTPISGHWDLKPRFS